MKALGIALEILIDLDGGKYRVNSFDQARLLYRYDVTAGKLGQSIAAHKDYDVQSGLLFDRRKKALVGVTFEAEKREFTWFDQEWATWQKMIDQTLAGHVNVLSRAQNAPVVLVASYSDKDPTSYYLFDPDKKQLERGVSARPWIDPAKMATQRFLRYPARATDSAFPPT